MLRKRMPVESGLSMRKPREVRHEQYLDSSTMALGV